MTNANLRDDQWEKIYAFLQQHPRAYAGMEAECRRYVEAVLWILRSGAQWRLLPEGQGN
jgi:transposase